MLKKVVAIIAAGVLALILLFAQLKPPIALPFPGQQKSVPTICANEGLNDNYAHVVQDGCVCNQSISPTTGFPIRSNNYDACQNGGVIVWWLQAINLLIIAGLALATFILALKL